MDHQHSPPFCVRTEDPDDHVEAHGGSEDSLGEEEDEEVVRVCRVSYADDPFLYIPVKLYLYTGYTRIRSATDWRSDTRFKAVLYSKLSFDANIDEILESVFFMCYPLLVNCIDYPDIVHGGKIEQRTLSIARRRGVRPREFTHHERLSSGIMAITRVLESYISRGKGRSLFFYMSKHLPYVYIGEVLREQTGRIVPWRVELGTVEDLSLPKTHDEYIEMVSPRWLESQVLTRRENIYRIFRRVTSRREP